MLSISEKSFQIEDAVVAEEMVNNCRLSLLNFDCLEKIFEQLSTNDLIKLCKINPIVCNAVIERAVSKRIINFTDWNEIWSTETIFMEIGKRIKLMSICEQNICPKLCRESTPIDYFLGLFVKHCTKNRLDALSLCFDVTTINQGLLEAAKPYFTKLRQIHYVSVGWQSNIGYEKLLATIIDSAQQLSTIQIEEARIQGAWLQRDNVKNVQNIALINSNILDKQNWELYVKEQPALKVFAWINLALPNRTLCKNIARNCNQLERFIDVQCLVPKQYLHADFVMNRYNYFSSFEKLKCARITAYTRSGRDLVTAFVALAQKNTLKKLSINFITNAIAIFQPYHHVQYPQFTSIKQLDIQNHSSCALWDRIIVNFMSGLVNLKQLTISGHESINSIKLAKIALAAPHLSVLKISEAHTPGKYLSKALMLIGEEMKGRKTGPKVFTVFINSEQKTYLEGHNFSDNIRIVEV